MHVGYTSAIGLTGLIRCDRYLSLCWDLDKCPLVEAMWQNVRLNVLTFTGTNALLVVLCPKKHHLRITHWVRRAMQI